jgi:hypothetical protein
MRQHRDGECICYCRVYRFPHRFGGGRCSGIWIAEVTWADNYGRGECTNCRLLNENNIGEPVCEALEGSESVTLGDCWQGFVNYEEIKIYEK